MKIISSVSITFFASYLYGQDMKLTEEHYKYSPNSITGIYLCTPQHVENGDCSDVDEEYYSNIALLSLGRYEIGLLEVNKQKSIAFKGPLSPGASNNLIRILEKYPEIKNLTLSSQGGSTEEALKITSYVREKNYHTWIPVRRMCLSACSLIFLSGTSPKLDGLLALHSPQIYLYDSYQISSLNKAKETFENLNSQNSTFLVSLMSAFVDKKIPLSLLSSIVDNKENFIVFTSMNDLYNFTWSDSLIWGTSKMSEFSKNQKVKNFDFQSYEQLF